MPASAVIPALVLAASALGPMPPSAVGVVPAEPGAVVLPDAAILQVVAADLDGDGRREVVRLVRREDDAALAEVWAERDGRWQQVGRPVEVVRPSRVGGRIDPVYSATPVRLIVRRVEGAERVTVASQPHFDEIDTGPPCCLLLHDLVIGDGGAVRREVAAPSDFADAVLALDLDGDGTDELLVTRNLPPVGDIAYPIDATVHRWTGEAFAASAINTLPAGSGDTPFRLGDSDGLPGEEAGIVSTLGPPGLFRIRLAEGDRLDMDGAGFVAEQAIAVPLEDGRGVAASGPLVGVMVAPWPAGGPAERPIAEAAIGDARLVGTATVADRTRLVVHQPTTDAVHLLTVPELLPPQGLTVTRSPAAAVLASSPLEPYSGPLPGGGPGGVDTVIHGGRLFPDVGGSDLTGTALMATLAGAEPVGLVGDGEWLAVHHAPIGPPAIGPDGGALTVPGPVPLGWTSIVPFALSRAPEADGADLEPPLVAARELARANIAAGPAGFIAQISAPPGSRIIATDYDPSVVRAPIVVPASGQIDVPMTAPTVSTPNPRYRATLLVATPAGHAYLAAWDVHLRTAPPELDVRAETSLGSPAVRVVGRTAPDTVVHVGGDRVPVDDAGRFSTIVHLPPWPTDVAVEADDGFGNVARGTVSGVGLFDYRGLPWVQIVMAGLAVAGIVLFLRVPRAGVARRDDDAALEELEPD